MGTTPTDQLPRPIRQIAPPPPPIGRPVGLQQSRPAQTAVRPAAAPPGGRARRTSILVGAFVAVLAIGATAAKVGSAGDGAETAQERARAERRAEREQGGDSEPAPDDTSSTDDGGGNGTAGNGTLTVDDVSTVYTFVLGVTPSNSSLECTIDNLGTAYDGVARLLAREILDQATAQQTFVPFLGCAPDADFLFTLAPAATTAVGGSADQTCVVNGLTSMTVADRAALLALAYVDTIGYTDWLATSFSGCAF